MEPEDSHIPGHQQRETADDGATDNTIDPSTGKKKRPRMSTSARDGQELDMHAIPPGAIASTSAEGSGPVSGKRGRGRPPGSKNKIVKTGPPLIPHVMLINHGEDLGDKLRELSRAYKRSIVILAASGSLSSATLTQLGTTGAGVGVTLRGQFTILSLSGAVLQGMNPEAENLPKRQARAPTVFMSASLANPSGGVVGGTVAGPLEAAGLVTLVIGHWDPDKSRLEMGEEDNKLTSAGLAPPQQPAVGLPAASIPAGADFGVVAGMLAPASFLPTIIAPNASMPGWEVTTSAVGGGGGPQGNGDDEGIENGSQ